MAKPSRLCERWRVEDGSKFRLKDFPSDDTGDFKSRADAEELLAEGVRWLAEEQEKLYAQDKYGVLLIFQAMDAAGKDGTIKHVMSGINPAGCEVYSFKAPNAEELDHDFMWRCMKHLPQRGRIGVFNRSYYEEVLVVRVHQQLLKAQKLPPECMGGTIWEERFEAIRNFEHYFTRQGYVVRKFFLNVSSGEQKKRFLSRLEDPEKNWKFSQRDVEERKHWNDYMKAYEEMIRATSTPHAPWYVVPADKKWYTRLVVAEAVVEALDGLGLRFPAPDPSKKRELEAIEESLRNGD